MKLQEYFARQACKEMAIANPMIKIDHLKGITYINDRQYGLIFPRSLVEYCKSLWSEKTQNYYFKGVIDQNRNWLLSYSGVTNSHRGRNKKIKYTVDYDYYQSLSRSKFALAPVGECPWSYRFFEAIMCGAIPILGNDDIDIFANEYKYYRHGDKKLYNLDYVNYNYSRLIKNVLL